MRSQFCFLLVAMALTAWSAPGAQISSEPPPVEAFDGVTVEVTIGSKTSRVEPGSTVTDVRALWIHAPGQRIVESREVLAHNRAYSLVASDGFCLALSYPLGETAPELVVSTWDAGTTVRVAQEAMCQTCLTVRDRWYDPFTTNCTIDLPTATCVQCSDPYPCPPPSVPPVPQPELPSCDDSFRPGSPAWYGCLVDELMGTRRNIPPIP